jgi:hypothetical protein
LEKGGGLLSDSEKAEGETKEGELDENKVKCTSDTCNFLPYLSIVIDSSKFRILSLDFCVTCFLFRKDQVKEQSKACQLKS